MAVVAYNTRNHRVHWKYGSRGGLKLKVKFRCTLKLEGVRLAVGHHSMLLGGQLTEYWPSAGGSGICGGLASGWLNGAFVDYLS